LQHKIKGGNSKKGGRRERGKGPKGRGKKNTSIWGLKMQDIWKTIIK